MATLKPQPNASQTLTEQVDPRRSPFFQQHDMPHESVKKEAHEKKFLYPFFESDSEDISSELDCSPSTTVLPISEYTPPSRGLQSRNVSSRRQATKVSKNSSLKNKPPGRRPVVKQTGHRRSGQGRKRTVLARIKDKITYVEVQYNPSNTHVKTINGQPARKALYGFMGEESKLQRLKSDQDIVLADSKGNAGYCQGCKDLKVTRHLYRWIDHKICCKALQSKLQHELKMQKVEVGPRTNMSRGNFNEDRLTEVRQVGKAPTYRFKNNEIVSVRVNKEIENFRYNRTKAGLTLDGKTLDEIFYGKRLPKGSHERETLFSEDPDMESLSFAIRICVCRGCGDTISIAQTQRWLDHRFRCPALQKQRALPSLLPDHLADNGVQNSSNVSTHRDHPAPSSSTSTTLRAPSAAPKGSTNRKQKLVFNLDSDEEIVLPVHAH